MLIGSMKLHQLAIHWLTNPVVTFALLFTAGSIISLILSKKLQNMIENVNIDKIALTGQCD
jgi:hypothetical protein